MTGDELMTGERQIFTHFQKSPKGSPNEVQADQLYISPQEKSVSETPWGTFLSTCRRRQQLATANRD